MNHQNEDFQATGNVETMETVESVETEESVFIVIKHSAVATFEINFIHLSIFVFQPLSYSLSRLMF